MCRCSWVGKFRDVHGDGRWEATRGYMWWADKREDTMRSIGAIARAGNGAHMSTDPFWRPMQYYTPCHKQIDRRNTRFMLSHIVHQFWHCVGTFTNQFPAFSTCGSSDLITATGCLGTRGSVCPWVRGAGRQRGRIKGGGREAERQGGGRLE